MLNEELHVVCWSMWIISLMNSQLSAAASSSFLSYSWKPSQEKQYYLILLKSISDETSNIRHHGDILMKCPNHLNVMYSRKTLMSEDVKTLKRLWLTRTNIPDLSCLYIHGGKSKWALIVGWTTSGNKRYVWSPLTKIKRMLASILLSLCALS